jgi:hypothetical protein
MVAERLPTNYRDIKDMSILEAEDLLSIELSAKTLSLDESLEAIFLTIDDLSEYEQNIVKRVWRRGRNLGVQAAGDNLFKQMSLRSGTQACVEYLKQMSSAFQLVVTPNSPSSGGGFSFNVFPPGTVVMPSNTQPPQPDYPIEPTPDYTQDSESILGSKAQAHKSNVLNFAEDD